MWWRRKAYDELPALSVRRRDLRKSLRIIIIAYVFGVSWMSCSSGIQLKVFCCMLGFTDLHFGWLTAIPFAATIGQLVAAVFIERTGLRKFQFIECATFHRLLWFLIAFLPLLFGAPSGAAIVMLLVVYGASQFASALAVPAYITWLGDLVPRQIRGRYIANRERMGTLAQIVLALSIGIILDAVSAPGAPETRSAQPMLLATIIGIFVVGATLGVIDIRLFHRVRDVAPRSAGSQRPAADFSALTLRALLWDPWKDRVFRHYVFYGAVVTFSATVGAWFFWRHATDGLGFSKLATNFTFLVVGPASGILTARGWGALIDRWGRRPVLITATLGAVFSIVPWLLMPPHATGPQWLVDGTNWVSGHVGGMFGHPGWAWATPQTPVGAYLLALLGCFIGGSMWMGVGLAQTGIVLGFSDGQGRSKYVATSSVLISLGGFFGGVGGGLLAWSCEHLQQAPLHLGPLIWTNWHLTFLVAMITRLLSVALLIRMPDPGARPVRGLLRYWGAYVYNNVSTRLFYPLRVFGWGRPKDDEKKP